MIWFYSQNQKRSSDFFRNVMSCRIEVCEKARKNDNKNGIWNGHALSSSYAILFFRDIYWISLKNALVFDMEFYFGHIIIHTYVRTSLYVCITIWEYTCTNMFSDAGKTYFGIPYIFASNLTLVFAFFILSHF